LIQVESSNSDLVFLGIPNIQEGREQLYVDQVNRLCHNVGTVILVKASSHFKNLEIGHSKGMTKQERSDFSESDVDLVISRKIKVPEINYPSDPGSAAELKKVFDAIKSMNEEVFNTQMVDLFSLNRSVYAEIIETSNNSLNTLEQKLRETRNNDEWRNVIGKTYRTIFSNVIRIIDKQEESTFKEQKEILAETVKLLKEKCSDIILQSPELMMKGISRNDLLIRKGDSWRTVMYKFKKQLFFGSFRGVKQQKVRYKRLIESYFDQRIYGNLTEVLQNWGMISLQQVIKTQSVNNRVFDSYFMLNKLSPGQDTEKLIEEKIQTNKELREQIDKLNEASLQTFYTLLLNKTFFLVGQISKDLQRADTLNGMRASEKVAAEKESLANNFASIPDQWMKNQLLLSNFTRLELMLFIFITHAKDVLQEFHRTLNRHIDQNYIVHLQQIEAAAGHSTRIFHETLIEVGEQLDVDAFKQYWEESSDAAIKRLAIFSEEISPKIELLERSIFDNFKSAQFGSHKEIVLRARKMLEFILQQEFIKPIETVTKESLQWYVEEGKRISTLVEEAMTVSAMLKNDKSKASDLPQLKNYTERFSMELQNADKYRTRMLNQVQERINALMDKFSLNAITRRSGFLRKFVR
jgi:hypothetical protein